jgi:hypothetical protein
MTMSGREAKQLAEQVLSRLPDDATIEDVQYSLYVADLVRRRSLQIDAALDGSVDSALKEGTLIPQDEVIKRMARWLRK